LRQLDPYSLDIEAIRSDCPEKRRRRACAVRPTGRGVQHRRWAYIQGRVLEELDRQVSSDAAYHLLGLYWVHHQVRQEGDHILVVDMGAQRHDWLALCQEAQERIRDLVQQQELVVEVNPTSNRVIGPLRQLADHHVFRMTLDDHQRLAREIRVTINTDDPGVFNTSLAHEFYLLGEILLRRGVPEAEVVEWLKWLRDNGNDFSFTRALPDRQDPRLRRILKDLERASRSLSIGGGAAQRKDAFWRQRRAAR
jgi:hypothetical protein